MPAATFLHSDVRLFSMRRHEHVRLSFSGVDPDHFLVREQETVLTCLPTMSCPKSDIPGNCP